MAPRTEARLLELRRHHPSWGQVRLRHQLERDGVEDVPSLSGIYRALRRHNLIEPKAKRKKLPTYKRWEEGDEPPPTRPRASRFHSFAGPNGGG